MESIEETLEREGKMPSFYKRYVDDTLTIMPDTTSAATFVQVLNNCHSSVKFTMETVSNGVLPFLGMQIFNRAPHIETKVYVTPTNTGLLLHYQSHVVAVFFSFAIFFFLVFMLTLYNFWARIKIVVVVVMSIGAINEGC